VLDTLAWLASQPCWVEITTLLIPGLNDSAAEVRELATWVLNHMGADVPLHFSAFHPAYKLQSLPRTPGETLTRARDMARSIGLRHVYTGNVHDIDGDTTRCSACDHPLIVRDWFELKAYNLGLKGECEACGTALAGHFEARPGTWGRRRRPVVL